MSQLLSLCILVPMTTNLHSLQGKHPPFAIKIQGQAVRFWKTRETVCYKNMLKRDYCNFLMHCPPLSVMCFSGVEWRENAQIVHVFSVPCSLQMICSWATLQDRPLIQPPPPLPASFLFMQGLVLEWATGEYQILLGTAPLLPTTPFIQFLWGMSWIGWAPQGLCLLGQHKTSKCMCLLKLYMKLFCLSVFNVTACPCVPWMTQDSLSRGTAGAIALAALAHKKGTVTATFGQSSSLWWDDFQTGWSFISLHTLYP